MKICRFSLVLATAAVMAVPLASYNAAFGQRGGRDGSGGRDGGSNRGGGGERGGDRGGRSISGSGPFSDGERSNSGGERNRDDNRAARSNRNFSFDGGQTRERAGAQSQRTFYRGPDGRDGVRTQGSRDLNWDRSGSRGGRDGDRNGDDRRNRDRADNRDRNWSDFDRSDFDRSDFDRSEISRYGRDRYGRDHRGWWTDDFRRNWWRGYDGGNIPFRTGWWTGRDGDNWPVYSPYRYSRWSNRPNYWWGYTTAPLLTNWLVLGFDRPRYWGYGPGANIYYQDDYVYYDNRRTIPVDDYYQRIYDLAHSVPNISQSEAESMDWRPLGVFAVGRDANAGSQRALQLAINQVGLLTGTYFNRENGEVHPVSGMVDERTQRAAWAFADGTQKEVVFETALYNLTRDHSTMMVHFGPSADEMEVWHLVRLEEPESASTAQPGTTKRNLP